MSAAPTPHAARRRRLGQLEALVSGVGFGFLGILGKAAMAAGFTPGEQLALRFVAAAALLWIYVIATRPREALLTPKDALRCAALGTFGYAVFSSCFFEALNGLSASLTVMLLYTYPVIVALGGWALFKQYPGRRKLKSLVPVSAGLALLVWGDISIAEPRAIGFGLASAVLYAFYILASSRLIGHLSPLISVCYIVTAAAVVLAVAHLAPSVRLISLVATNGWIVGATASLCTVMPMLLFLRALQKISPAEVSLLSTAEPITGVLAAALVLDERLSPVQIAGAAAIIVALVYMSRPEEARPHAVGSTGTAGR